MSFIRRRVLESGSIRYYPIVTQGPSRTHIGGYNRLTDARASLRAAEAAIAAGTFSRPLDVKFPAFAETWLKHKALSVRPSTIDGYKTIVRTHLSYFNNCPLSKITPQMIEEYKLFKSADLAPRTVNKTLTLLNSILKQAELWGYGKNPCRHVAKLKEPHKEMDFLNPDEVLRLLENSGEDYPLFLTAVLTGAREGELLGLKWGDFDPPNLYIRRTYNPKYGMQSPKTKSGARAVVLCELNISVLCSLRSERGGNPEQLIFPYQPSNMVRDKFIPALDRAELRHIRFHDLRHTYSALMIAAGANTKFLQVQLGHSNFSTTMNHYGHLIPESGGLTALEELIFSPKVIQMGAPRVAGQSK